MMDETLRKQTDGKLYTANDMVKTGCRDCDGCSSCCTDMGQSILVDPHDAWILGRHLGQDFQTLIGSCLEFHVEDGVILPNLRMNDKNQNSCSFLNAEGRCSVHSARPGICRLFPLGRNYEDERLTYFYLKDACPAANKTKVKVSKWLDMPNLQEYERFLIAWHDFVKKMKTAFVRGELDDEVAKKINVFLIQVFYVNPYVSDDFYPEFFHRLEQFSSMFDIFE